MASEVGGGEVVGELGVKAHVVGGTQVRLVDAGGAGERGGVDNARDRTAGVERAPQIQGQPAEEQDHDEHAEHPHGDGAALGTDVEPVRTRRANAAHGTGRLW
jgi:hypothetical protein